jgi:hypothetical protein
MSGSQLLLLGGTPQVVSDPNFEYTTLLLPGNGTNGAQNNTFLDSSTNNFTITRNGNTTQGTFSPFSQTGWGNYFDGTGDYLSIASNAAFSVGTGDFTQESWIYPLNWTGSISTIFVVSSTGGLWVGKNASNFVVRAFGVADQLQTTQFPAVNQWTHVAVVRSGTTLSLYYNGSRIATTTNSYNFAQGILAIGDDGGGSGPFAGYISNSRLVKGTAIYDPTASYFTPPTAPLTAVSGTSILTCQSNRFIDNSSNAFAITRNGDVSVQAFSPFNPTAAWSAATYGGSGYFDGSGDYLRCSQNTNAAFSLGTGDFTFEAWVFPTAYGGSGTFIACQNQSNGSAGLSFGLYLTSAGLTGLLVGPSSGGYAVNITGTTVPLNAWTHVAVTRSGNNFTVWKNGVSDTTATSTVTISQDSSSGNLGGWNIGASPVTAQNITGYISDARLVKGTAVYTTAFTPPTAPLTAITNTSLLTNFTNAGIYDATSKNDLETVGNAQISTTQSKFGGSSMYFDGTGDYLYGKNTRLLDIGSGDFTIEGWLYPTTSGTTRAIVSQFNTNGTGPGWTSYLKTTNVIEFYGGSGTITVTGTTAVSANAWSHFAICRYGSTITIYVNGVAGGTGTNSSFSDDTTGPVEVGARGGAGSIPFTGYIDDLRITKGIARYTSNFTPPTTAFPLL